MKLLLKSAFPIVLLFIFTFRIAIASGVPEKAQQALDMYNYFEAKKLFNKCLSKYPAYGSYGLSIIYSRNDNPFYNLDSAYVKALSAQDFFTLRMKKEAQVLRTFEIDSLSIKRHTSKIEGLAFDRAIKTGDVDSIRHFIDFYNLSNLVPAAVVKRDSIAYKSAVSTNTSLAYKNYINDYPQSQYITDARQRYNKAVFTEETKEGTIAAYAAFITNHPQSSYRQQAELKLYKLETEGKTDLASYYEFIKKYPDNSFTDEAWQKVYSLFRSENPSSTIPDFLEKYPDFAFKDRLLEEYKLEGIRYFPYKQGNNWGFIDENGEIAIDAKYEFVEEFSEGIAIVSIQGKLGYISKTGEEIAPAFYDEAENFHNNLAIVGENGKFGVLDRNGKMVAPLGFTEIGDFSEGLAAASDGKFFGYINRNGSVMIPFRFDAAGEFENGTAVCQINDLYGIIDSAGNEIIPFYYEGIENFLNGMAKVKKNEKMGLISREGATILDISYDEIGKFSNNRALVTKDNKLGYIDQNGRVVIPLIYKSIPESQLKCNFSNGYAIVKSGNYFGIIDTLGHKIVAPQFEDIGAFNDAWVPVKKAGKWGYFNLLTCKLMIKNMYEKATPFMDDLAIVYEKGKFGVINKKGKIVLPFENDALQYAGNNLFVCRRDTATGLIDRDNRELIPFEYENFSIHEKNYIKFTSLSGTLWYDIRKQKVFWKG